MDSLNYFRLTETHNSQNICKAAIVLYTAFCKSRTDNVKDLSILVTNFSNMASSRQKSTVTGRINIFTLYRFQIFKFLIRIFELLSIVSISSKMSNSNLCVWGLAGYLFPSKYSSFETFSIFFLLFLNNIPFFYFD